MTDFEIIVVQNVRARWERNNMEQEENNVPTYDSQQMDDDTMIINILSKAGPDPVPIPEPIFQPQDDMELLMSTSIIGEEK